jgi:F-type H+-transporting ATPase subunit delta
MAELSTVARPYAEAVFKLSRDTGSVQKWSDTLAFLELVVSDAQVQSLIGNPRITREHLTSLIVDVAGGRLDAEATRLVETLVENGRLVLLPSVRSQFEALRQANEGVVDAEITSAFELDASQTAELVKQLEAHLKRGVRPAVHVDPNLIGGVRIRVGDLVIDNSVRGRLDRMQAALTH